jgi:hypothetical protein
MKHGFRPRLTSTNKRPRKIRWESIRLCEVTGLDAEMAFEKFTEGTKPQVFEFSGYLRKGVKPPTIDIKILKDRGNGMYDIEYTFEGLTTEMLAKLEEMQDGFTFVSKGPVTMEWPVE